MQEVPAFAGMTGFGWEQEIPAFAGMTGFGWEQEIPAFAGIEMQNRTIENMILPVFTAQRSRLLAFLNANTTFQNSRILYLHILINYQLS